MKLRAILRKDTFTVEKKLPEFGADAQLNVVITFNKALPAPLEKRGTKGRRGKISFRGVGGICVKL